MSYTATPTPTATATPEDAATPTPTATATPTATPTSTPTPTATTGTAPAAPSGLSGFFDFPPVVVLTWTDNATNETDYRVERCTGSGCTDFVEIAIGPADSTSFGDVFILPSTTYRYRVRAAAGSLFSAYAGPVEVSTPA